MIALSVEETSSGLEREETVIPTRWNGEELGFKLFLSVEKEVSVVGLEVVEVG